MTKVDVPFHLTGGSQPLAVVPVTVNGEGPFRFALDTGAASPVLSPDLAHRLGLRIDETKEAAGAGGRVQIELARVEHFALGEACRSDVPVIVTSEMERIAAAVGDTLDGVVGFEFLRHFRTTVDYSRLVLVLEDGETAEPEDDEATLVEMPLRLAHPAKPLVLVPATINGKGPFPFALDTGASVSVLATDLAAQLGIRTQKAPVITGGGGSIAAGAGVVRSLAIEAAEVLDLPVAVAAFLDALAQVVGTELLGIVGYNYLRAFRLTIDYPGGTLRLSRPG
jgi:predicted aspartyl protease